MLVEGDTNSVLGAPLARRAQAGHPRSATSRRGCAPTTAACRRRSTASSPTTCADHLFAPTAHAPRTSCSARAWPADRIHVTGNTVVDELAAAAAGARGPGLLGALRRRTRRLRARHRAPRRERRARGAPARHLRRARRRRAARSGCRCWPRSTRAPPTKLETPRASRVGPAVRVLPPLGYLEFLGLHAEAALMLTDSGGLQEEACACGCRA